jgi:hypothetical protein
MIRSSIFWSFLMACNIFFFSCSKEKDQSPNMPDDGKVAIDLDVVIPTGSSIVNPDDKFELIISSSSGEVLFNSIGLAGGQVFGKFYTREKKVDLTTIYLNAATSKFEVNTYKGVDPTGWDTILPWFGQRFLNVNKPLTTAEVLFLNSPGYRGTPHFSSYIGSSSWILNPLSQSEIKVTYTRAPGVPIYLLFPVEGQYKIYVPQTNKDTVDLSVMGRAKRIPFDLNAQQSLVFSTLTGITDTNDISKSITLFRGSPNSLVSDLVYPVEPFQKYFLYLKGNGSANELFGFSSFTDSVPKTYNLPTSANFNITSSLVDNFSVNFIGDKPFVFKTKWSSEAIVWTIFSSVDSTKYQPLSMWRNFKSTLLQNVGIPSFRLSQFSMERSKNMDYARYISKCMISGSRWNLKDYVTAEYVKNY